MGLVFVTCQGFLGLMRGWSPMSVAGAKAGSVRAGPHPPQAAEPGPRQLREDSTPMGPGYGFSANAYLVLGLPPPSFLCTPRPHWHSSMRAENSMSLCKHCSAATKTWVCYLPYSHLKSKLQHHTSY